tara:strand:+ start:29793 stop:32009 length:2217 start_codon:yes stop_codon:yes gene_type:complete
MRFNATAIVTGLALVFAADSLLAYPLSLDQRKRFKRYLPGVFAKLEAQEPVHVVLLGDSVAGGYTPIESAWETNNPLFSYVGSFLNLLASEFFYTGGARLLNPPPGGSQTVDDLLGRSITFENLTIPDGTALGGLRRISTDAFLHHPDLVIIQFGIYDSLNRVSLDTYKHALQVSINEGREQNSDLIVIGPTLVNYGAGAMNFGIARPYSMAAKEVAAANGVMFMDAGQHLLSRFGGGVLPDTHPDAAMEIVEDRLRAIFQFGPELKEKERIHTGERANDYLAQSLFQELKDGPRPTKFSCTGTASFNRNGGVDVRLLIRNLTDDAQEGCIGALNVGDGLLPLQATQRFKIPAASTTQLAFTYTRPFAGKARDGSDILFPMQVADEFCRFSFVLEDTVSTKLVELPLRVGPVTAIWKSRHFLNVTDRIRVEWDLINATDNASSGTFQVGLGDKVGQPTDFSVSPLGVKSVFSLFDFDADLGNTPFQRDVWIQTEVNDRIVRFNHELESTRDLVLGENRTMKRWSDYANASPAGENRAQRRTEGELTYRFEADEEALYLTISMQGITVPDLGDEPAVRARLYLDARPTDEVLSFGVVEPIQIYTKGREGPGSSPELALGCFGNGYDMILDSEGVTSALVESDNGGMSVVIRIPRSYLHLHEWDLGSVYSMLGFRIDLTIADPSTDGSAVFSNANTFVSHSPTWAFENKAIHSFDSKDARSLSVLRLSRQPVQSWSVRIY